MARYKKFGDSAANNGVEADAVQYTELVSFSTSARGCRRRFGDDAIGCSQRLQLASAGLYTDSGFCFKATTVSFACLETARVLIYFHFSTTLYDTIHCIQLSDLESFGLQPMPPFQSPHDWTTRCYQPAADLSLNSLAKCTTHSTVVYTT